MQKTILVRTVADATSGYGHLIRMLTVSNYFRTKGHEILFSLDRCSDQAADRIAKVGYQRIDGLQKTDYVFFDIIDATWIQSCEMLYKEIDECRRRGIKTVFFDGRGSISYRAQPNVSSLSTLIAPYVGEDPVQTGPAECMLVGPRYFPIDLSYRCFRSMSVRKKISNIMITAGGSDPYNVTPILLNAVLATKCIHAQITVIVGGMFSSETIGNIQSLSKQHKNRVTLAYAPEGLAEIMAVSDLCICANGLTKYELATMGVPTIAISITPDNHRINEDFAQTGALYLAGYLDDLDFDNLISSINSLVSDHQQRVSMSAAACKLIDGRGLNRIKKSLGL